LKSFKLYSSFERTVFTAMNVLKCFSQKLNDVTRATNRIACDATAGFLRFLVWQTIG